MFAVTIRYYALLSVLPLLLTVCLPDGHAEEDSGSATQKKADQQSLTIGIQLAKEAQQIQSSVEYPKYKGDQGILVAEGDSWFDYPLFTDVLEDLKNRHQYRIESVAHHGDTLESMVYNPSQLARLSVALKRLKDKSDPPRAILLSAGGNDLAGPEFLMLLNHARSGLPPLSAPMLSELIDIRLRAAYISFLQAVTILEKNQFSTEIPILIHGYSYPVPDGRGYLGGFWILPGPWLKPSFDQKGHGALKDNTDQMKVILDKFNAMLVTLPNVPGLKHVRYVKVAGLLKNDLANYKDDWDNELHPSKDGFRIVAKAFNNVIQTIPKP